MGMMDGSATSDTNRSARGGLVEIGTMLRNRREEIGRDLATIAAATHIRGHYLKAIEEGRRKDLPGTAYMIGYIRTYANYLGFDGNRLINDYHDVLTEQHKWVDKRAEPPHAVGSLPQFQISPVKLLAGLLVLGVGGYVGWGYATAPKDEGAMDTATVEAPVQDVIPDTPPVVAPAPTPTVSSPTVPSPTGANASATGGDTPAETPAETPGASVGEAEDQVPPEAEIASPADEPGTSQDANTTGSVASTGEEPGTGEEAGTGAEAGAGSLASTGGEAGTTGEAVGGQSAPQQASAAAAEAPTGKIVVRARLESWVQVTNAAKEVIFSRVLRAGETYTVPDEPGLLFTTGNAGGVEIEVDGTRLRSLGTVGLVKRDIPLDPEKLKDGSAFKTNRVAPATTN
jgi:cytoskeleton protein RodZ